MPTQLTREDVQRMTVDGAVLVDTLPEGEYAEEHIAGAVNIPLRKLVVKHVFAHESGHAMLLAHNFVDSIALLQPSTFCGGTYIPVFRT